MLKQKRLYFELYSTKNGYIVIWCSIHYERFKRLTDRRSFEIQEVNGMIERISEMLGGLSYNYTDRHEVNNKYISISHSKGWFALYISSVPVGIDIEILDHRIQKAKKYFLQKSEVNRYNSLQDLHIIWGAKEAFYKLINGLNISSLSEICIHHLDQQTVEIEYNSALVRLSHKQIDDVFIVWTD